ncbi:MAG TPA: cystathionine beta-synthase, partial [Acidimicrobiales bacterium]
QPPERLAARAAHVLRAPAPQPGPDLVAELRIRIPRHVGVIGPEDEQGARFAAVALHHAGLPVTLYSDDLSPVHEGVGVLPVTDRGPTMEVAESLLELVGNTPLVRLDRMGRDLSCHLLAKLEFLNPGGSVKDRPAMAMVEAAERAGLLRRGGTIVEPTSGNTGVGLAIIAARRRYRCIFVMPDKMSREKVDLLRAYGAEVVVCPTAVAPDHPESYYSVAARLAAEIPGAFQPDQYHNPENPLVHQHTTGPEIWRQTAGRVTHVVAGIGTGGTITGVSRALKAVNPAVQMVGADPEGSVYSGGSGRPYLVEGIGEDFWPDTFDPAAVDRTVVVTDRDSFLTARRVTREEGILIGGSGGTAVWAALHVGAELGPDDVVVVIVPDSGRGYLSKIYNDGWMADFGFLRAGGLTVGEVLARKSDRLPALVHLHPDETVRTAVDVLREYEVSQVPVVKAELPLAMAEVVGAVHERDLMDQVFRDRASLDWPIGKVMSPPLPAVGSGELVEVAVEALETAGAVLVVDAGHPVGILTRSDVLSFLSPPRQQP